MRGAKNSEITIFDCLSSRDFAKKYDLDVHIVTLAVKALYKQHRHAKAQNTGHLTSVIIGPSCNHKIHPFFHDIVLAEVKKQQDLLLTKNKGMEK